MCVHEHAHVYAYVSVLTLIPVKILANVYFCGGVRNVTDQGHKRLKMCILYNHVFYKSVTVSLHS